MPCNCAVSGLNEMFDDRLARHEAKRFRKRGLNVRARKLLHAIENALPLPSLRSLEVGAGVGGLTISLLRRGVAHASIVDASRAYVATARLLADEMGVGERLDIECGDFVERAPALESVDLVVLDRVVCCYPAWQQLLPEAAHKANRAIALTWPRDVWWSRTGVAVGIWVALVGVDFALLWGLLAFVLNYIPNFGSLVAAVPAILLAWVQLGPAAALLVALGYLVVNITMGSVLEPRIMGQGLGLSTLVVFLSLLAWGWILGTVGMFLAVPLTVALRIVLESNPSTRWIAVLMGPADEAEKSGTPPHFPN